VFTIALGLILLHTADGRAVLINPGQVVYAHTAHKQVTSKAACVVTFSSGQFLSVREPCEEVRRLIEGRP
jgi:hypothetical protein